MRLLPRSKNWAKAQAPHSRHKVWDRVGAIDWPITRVLGLSQHRRIPLRIANFLSRLGDGPIYLVIIAALILFDRHSALTILFCAVGSIALLHSVYPTLKRFTARPRPRDVAGAFPHAHPALDQFSFPSGHVMTLTAALTPIVYESPRIWPVGLAAWAAMAWSRLAIGQHFASDIAAGTILGAAVSGGLTYLVAS